jgi:NADPH:quinone reductase
MRAWIGTGRPDDLIEWSAVERPRPVAGEVLVAVEAYSINRGETFRLACPEGGRRPGKDIAGTVVETGPGVTSPAVGDRVVAHPEEGGWAEFAVVPVDAVAAIPDTMPSTVAAALPLAGLTALRLLRVVGSLAGKSVLLTGASGGVGHYVVELAAAQGARITAVVGTPERGERLRALGAAAVVLDVAATEGPFDVVIESVGGPVFAAAWSRLHARGLLLWLGQASREPVALNFFDWSGGSSGTLRKFSYVDDDRSVAEDLATLVRLVEDGHLHPEIDGVRAWEETPQAVQALLRRQFRGNVVLAVAS